MYKTDRESIIIGPYLQEADRDSNWRSVSRLTAAGIQDGTRLGSACGCEMVVPGCEGTVARAGARMVISVASARGTVLALGRATGALLRRRAEGGGTAHISHLRGEDEDTTRSSTQRLAVPTATRSMGQAYSACFAARETWETGSLQGVRGLCATVHTIGI